jgi:uncharacterized protein (UPF0305 family)
MEEFHMYIRCKYIRNRMGTGMFLVQPDLHDRETAEITRRCRAIRKARTRGELGNLLVCEVMHYSTFDLQVVGGNMRNEIRKLPSPYREAVGPYFIDQIFGMHHRLLAQFRDGEFRHLEVTISDRELFDRFLDMVPRGCFSWDADSERRLTMYRPLHRFFYYLISCYTLFVIEYPGHPVGMPFPGPFKVEEKDGIYFCPIRDKEKDVFYSICNFCPARQSEKTS